MVRNTAVCCLLAVLFGCNGEEEKDPVTIGLLTPKSGQLEYVGLSFERVTRVAVETINANGGANGHELVLVVKDTESDATVAIAAMTEAVETDGVVAVVGPARSDSVANTYELAKTHGVPAISPSSTAPELRDADDDGYLFRNVSDDNIQGLAQAYYLALAPSGPAITTAAIIHETGSYGEGLATSFEAAFESACGTCDVPDTHIISYDGEAPLTAATAGNVVDALNALSPAPEWVMLVALEQDGVKVVNAWYNGGVPVLPGVRWFLTDGARNQGFLGGTGSVAEGIMGTAPTYPITGNAYGVLREAYEAAHDDSLEEQVFAANVWDAVHLIAAAIAKQSADGAETIGGPGLRDALTDISAGPGQIFNAGQWRNLVGAIDNGSEVDYDGASGPNDFDADGEAIGPYEVWEIVSDGIGGYTFRQVLFIAADEFGDLIPSN